MKGAKYIVKTEDTSCLDPDKLKKLLQDANEPEYGYFGQQQKQHITVNIRL